MKHLLHATNSFDKSFCARLNINKFVRLLESEISSVSYYKYKNKLKSNSAQSKNSMASSNFQSARTRDSLQVLLGRQKSRKRFYDLSACCSSVEMSAKLVGLFLVLIHVLRNKENQLVILWSLRMDFLWLNVPNYWNIRCFFTIVTLKTVAVNTMRLSNVTVPTVDFEQLLS